VTITADTNVLVRAAVIDDVPQTELAVGALLEAEAVAVTLPSLCEFVWVLTRAYGRKSTEVAESIRIPIQNANVLVDELSPNLGDGRIRRQRLELAI
jgi:predicted nucleic-acid-binding protein